MKRPSILLWATLTAALLTLFSCGPAKDRVRLEGKFAGISDAEFYVYSEDGAFDGIDTVKISEGKFAYERKLTAPAVLTLLYPNYTQTLIVAEPGHTIRIKGDAAKIGEAEITGTEENEDLTDFRLKHLNESERKLRLAAAQYVRSHASQLSAVAMFRKYFAQPQNTDANTALTLLDVLVKAQPQERSVRRLDNFYRPIYKNSIGQKMPAFEGESLDGKTVRSSDFAGKHLVIACVATWQDESRLFLQQLRRQMKQAGAGWQCIIVSLDVEKEALRKQLESDTISYPTLCDRKAFESPLVRTLGLHYVPSVMVVDPQGTIIQRDVTKVSDIRM